MAVKLTNDEIEYKCLALGVVFKEVLKVWDTRANKQGSFPVREMLICNCIKCASELSTRLDHVTSGRNKSVRCETCVVNKYKEILASRGCTFVRKYTENKNHSYSSIDYIDLEGTLRTTRSSTLVNKEFLTAEKRGRGKYYLYRFAFAKDENLYFKLGYSFDPYKRLRALKIRNECSVHILREFNSEKEAREFEQKVHKGFEECKISSEEARTFTDGTSVSRSKYGSKVRKSGVTEWFKIPLKYYCLIGDPVSYYLYEKGVYDYKTRT